MIAHISGFDAVSTTWRAVGAYVPFGAVGWDVVGSDRWAVACLHEPGARGDPRREQRRPSRRADPTGRNRPRRHRVATRSSLGWLAVSGPGGGWRQ